MDLELRLLRTELMLFYIHVNCSKHSTYLQYDVRYLVTVSIYETFILQTLKHIFALFLKLIRLLFFVLRPPTDISLRLWQEPTWVGSERPARWLLCKLCLFTHKHQHGHTGCTEQQTAKQLGTALTWIAPLDVIFHCTVTCLISRTPLSHFPTGRPFHGLALHI